MKEYTFDELSLGQRFRTQFDLKESIAKDFLKSLNIENIEGQPLPVAVFSTLTPIYKAIGARFPQGTIHLKQKMEHYGNPYIGDIFDIEVLIASKYEKKGRQYLVFETSFIKDNKLICKQESTQLMAFA